MRISYLITVHNEGTELSRLLKQLYAVVEHTDDEIVILDDFSEDENTKKILLLHTMFSSSSSAGVVVQHKLDGDFATHKNYGSKRCTGDYIVQLDADEYLAPELLTNLREIIEANPTVELFRVPRVNTVMGLTQEDARRWGWRVDWANAQAPVVNFPDYQSRIYKNSLKIQWKKKLHETIFGAEYVTELPPEPAYAIIHPKTIERQRAQNEFYNKNWSEAANMGQG